MGYRLKGDEEVRRDALEMAARKLGTGCWTCAQAYRTLRAGAERPKETSRN